MGDNDEKLTDASVEASASEQTADGVTDPEADSSWLVSTEMVPVVTSEAEDIADKTTAQDSPDESPVQTGYDACLAVRCLKIFRHACSLFLRSKSDSCLQEGRIADSGSHALLL